MASSSSSAPLLALPVTEKLSKSNLVLWQAQVMPAIRGAQLESHLDREAAVPPKELTAQIDGKPVKQANPEYITWVAKDQQVLSYLLTSMTREVMTQAAVEVIFSSQTRTRAMNTRIALATTQKGTLSMADYIAKMKTYVDDMTVAGKPLEDDDVISYVLTGLDTDYNPIATSILTRADPIGLDEFFSQLLSFEMRLDMQHHGGGSSSANMASRGNGRGRGFRGRGRGRGGGSSRGRGNKNNSRPPNARGNNTNNGGTRGGDRCQICGRGNHSAVDCWFRFDEDYIANEKSASAAMHSYGVDTNWYTDTGSTDHITSDLNKLHVHNSYHGNDQIKTTNGILLRGKCEGGLYPIPTEYKSHALSTFKPSTSPAVLGASPLAPLTANAGSPPTPAAPRGATSVATAASGTAGESQQGAGSIAPDRSSVPIYDNWMYRTRFFMVF
nr:unnamed protein product [Digitaria exilis]